MSFSSSLAVGMDVVSPAGETIGRIKDVRTNDFLVDMAMRRDVYVPLSAVREVGGLNVVLNITRAEVGDQGWDLAPLLGGPQDSEGTADRGEVVVGTGDPAERGAWSASSDAYSLEPLDTRGGQQATSGADDGAAPPAAGFDAPVETTPPKATEIERLRDTLG